MNVFPPILFCEIEFTSSICIIAYNNDFFFSLSQVLYHLTSIRDCLNSGSCMENFKYFWMTVS